MINLMPYERKRQLKAAHTNAKLSKYLIFLSFSLGFLIMVFAGSYVILNNLRNSNLDTSIESNSSNISLDGKLSQANTTLSTAQNIINDRFSYSTLLMELGAALPEGSKIAELELDDLSNSSRLSVQIVASRELTNEINQGFSSSQYFSNYQQLSSSDNLTNPDYPILYSYNLTIRREN